MSGWPHVRRRQCQRGAGAAETEEERGPGRCCRRRCGQEGDEPGAGRARAPRGVATTAARETPPCVVVAGARGEGGAKKKRLRSLGGAPPAAAASFFLTLMHAAASAATAPRRRLDDYCSSCFLLSPTNGHNVRRA